MIIQYVRDDRGVKFGVVVADLIKWDGKEEIHYGYSICRTEMDKFDQKKGLGIATARLYTPERPCMAKLLDPDNPDVKQHIPEKVRQRVLETLEIVKRRAHKYFQLGEPALKKESKNKKNDSIFFEGNDGTVIEIKRKYAEVLLNKLAKALVRGTKSERT